MDGFVAALALGYRQIRIPFLSICVVGMCSGVVTCMAMMLGHLLYKQFPDIDVNVLGSWMFISLGMYMLAQRYIKMNWYRNRLVIQILFTPQKADIDQSGSISMIEASWLGISLSLDAIGAGLGAVWIGFEPWFTSLCIAIASGICLKLGLHIGYRATHCLWFRKLLFIPGSLFIAIGILKINS